LTRGSQNICAIICSARLWKPTKCSGKPMKLNPSLAISLAAISLAAIPVLGTVLSFSYPLPVVAQGSPQAFKFHCGQFDGQPATIAKHSHTPTEIVIIRWTKDMGAYNAYTAQNLCQTVSQRLQVAYANKTLRQLTTGMINGQRVICVAQSRSGGCAPDGLLFATPPGSNARAFLANILYQSKFAPPAPLNGNCVPKRVFDTRKDVIIDMAEFFYQCPTEADGAP
jgi:hypothetical protein